MRTLAAIGTFIAGLLLVSFLMVPGASARNVNAPVLQTTETATAAATATTAATAAATTAATAAATTAATAAATTAATTTAATPTTTTPGALPRTGGDAGMSSAWLLGGALLLTCLAVGFLVASRRSARL